MSHVSLPTYTASGSATADERVEVLVQRVGQVVANHLGPRDVRTLALIGGYGRGEGGVRETPQGDFPNNNLDFLMIRRPGRGGQIRNQLPAIEDQLEAIRDESQIGIDLSTVSATQLQRASCRVMWYDMRFGHRVVWGDAKFIRQLRQFTVQRIPAWDMHNLLANRGTLMVINSLLDGSSDPALAPLVTRHTVKAIIGFGDALLYTCGKYHWSYVEKRARMRQATNLPTSFRQLYDLAAEQRFAPATSLPDELQDLAAIQRECETAHRLFESHRLGKNIHSWKDYLPTAIHQGWTEARGSFRQSLRAARSWLRSPFPAIGEYPGKTQLALRLLPAERMLATLFPCVAYPEATDDMCKLAQRLLRTTSRELPDLRAGYLRAWGQHVDRNLHHCLKRCGLNYIMEADA